jgi:tetratricopeptide (TPR) repeat protein
LLELLLIIVSSSSAQFMSSLALYCPVCMLLSLLLPSPLGRTLHASRSSAPRASTQAPSQRDTPQAAVERLQQHLSQHPTDAAALLELGVVWELLGLPLSAVECLTSAIEHAVDAPLSAAVHERLGSLLADEDQPDEAEVALWEAVALDETRGASLHPMSVASSPPATAQTLNPNPNPNPNHPSLP